MMLLQVTPGVVLSFAAALNCSRAAGRVAELLHISKCGGTSLCLLGLASGMTSPGADANANCLVGPGLSVASSSPLQFLTKDSPLDKRLDAHPFHEEKRGAVSLSVMGDEIEMLWQVGARCCLSAGWRWLKCKVIASKYRIMPRAHVPLPCSCGCKCAYRPAISEIPPSGRGRFQRWRWRRSGLRSTAQRGQPNSRHAQAAGTGEAA